MSTTYYQILVNKTKDALIAQILELEAKYIAEVTARSNAEQQLKLMRGHLGLPMTPPKEVKPSTFSLKKSERTGVTYGTYIVHSPELWTASCERAKQISKEHGYIAVFVKCGKLSSKIQAHPENVPAEVKS